MTKLTIKQERALARMTPEAAKRRRATMTAERMIVMASKHDDAAISAGLDDLVMSNFRSAIRAGMGK